MTYFLFQGVCVALPLAYILPAACYVKLAKGPLLSRDKFPALVIATFGAVVFVIGIAQSLNEAIDVREFYLN